MSDHQQQQEHSAALSFWCDVCSLDCQSDQSFQQHIQGRKHNKKLGHRTDLGFCPTTSTTQALLLLADEEEFFDNLANGQYRNIIILTGAGVSTAAGIPDYRSSGGFFERFQKQYKGRFPGIEATPESLFSRAFVNQYPEVWENELLPSKQDMFRGLEPTLTHKFCAYLAQQGWLKRIYTQNIDGLHSHPSLGIAPEKVVECHGSIRRGDLVLYGDSLPDYFDETVRCDFDPQDTGGRVDLILVMGTSLQVAPFCALPNMAPKGSTRVLVNRNLSDCIRNPYGAQSWIEIGCRVKATTSFGKYHKEVSLESLWMKRDKVRKKKWQQLLVEDDSDAFVQRYMEKTNIEVI
mmetsp:Transcript_44856/g.108407  ORF Transcript_44856/g.108407 Transcript_44856/m.108407 type:complete len:349 (+) Transcript_44856:94-1140(+)